MDTHQKFQERAAKLRDDASKLFDEAHAEQDEARATELVAQGEKMVADSLTWDERAEKAGNLAQQRLEDAERVFDGPAERAAKRRDGTLRPEALADVPNETRIAERVELFKRTLDGERLTDQEYESVAVRLPHERLWLRALLTEGKDPFVTKGLDPLTADERQAFRAGMAAENEAQLRFMGVGQANAGASFVPTLVANRVVATMAYVGVMGDVGNGMTVTPLPPGGKIDVPQLTDAHSTEAGAIAEGATTAATDLTTSKVSLAPAKRSFLLELSEELIQANVVAFESRVVGLVGTFFGRTMAKDLTNGNGSGTNSQGVATGAVAHRRQVATSGTLVEDDVLGLYGDLDTAYEMEPSVMYQANKANVVRFMGLKGTGDWRAFPLTADRRLPVMPGGLPLRYNPQLSPGIAAGNDILLLGAMAKYELAYSPLRAARDYAVDKDVHQLGFYMSWDGDFGDQRAFKRLEGQ